MKNIKLKRVAPAEIEKMSMEIISGEMPENSFTPEQLNVVKRCVHTAADFDYVKNLKFTDKAISAAVQAIKDGCTIVTDTQMAYSGVNKRVLERFGSRAVCFMSDPDVAEEAKTRGETRATVSMERASAIEGKVILAVGNAPTALVRACTLMDEGKFSPVLIIGAPVGFVNVVESKELLCSTHCEYIAATGRKGGSNIAAAICNALIYMASDNARE